jgi:hypothetical protein
MKKQKIKNKDGKDNLFSNGSRDNVRLYEKGEDLPTLSEIKTGRVTGVVFDKAGSPKAGVKVSIQGSITNSSLNYGCSTSDVNVTSASFVTGSDGMYMFENVMPSSFRYKCGEGSASINIHYGIYVDNVWKQSVSVQEGQTTNVDIIF